MVDAVCQVLGSEHDVLLTCKYYATSPLCSVPSYYKSKGTECVGSSQHPEIT